MTTQPLYYYYNPHYLPYNSYYNHHQNDNDVSYDGDGDDENNNHNNMYNIIDYDSMYEKMILRVRLLLLLSSSSDHQEQEQERGQEQEQEQEQEKKPQKKSQKQQQKKQQKKEQTNDRKRLCRWNAHAMNYPLRQLLVPADQSVSNYHYNDEDEIMDTGTDYYEPHSLYNNHSTSLHRHQNQHQVNQRFNNNSTNDFDNEDEFDKNHDDDDDEEDDDDDYDDDDEEDEEDDDDEVDENDHIIPTPPSQEIQPKRGERKKTPNETTTTTTVALFLQDCICTMLLEWILDILPISTNTITSKFNDDNNDVDSSTNTRPVYWIRCGLGYDLLVMVNEQKPHQQYDGDNDDAFIDDVFDAVENINNNSNNNNKKKTSRVVDDDQYVEDYDNDDISKNIRTVLSVQEVHVRLAMLNNEAIPATTTTTDRRSSHSKMNRSSNKGDSPQLSSSLISFLNPYDDVLDHVIATVSTKHPKVDNNSSNKNNNNNNSSTSTSSVINPTPSLDYFLVPNHHHQNSSKSQSKSTTTKIVLEEFVKQNPKVKIISITTRRKVQYEVEETVTKGNMIFEITDIKRLDSASVLRKQLRYNQNHQQYNKQMTNPNRVAISSSMYDSTNQRMEPEIMNMKSITHTEINSEQNDNDDNVNPNSRNDDSIVVRNIDSRNPVTTLRGNSYNIKERNDDDDVDGTADKDHEHDGEKDYGSDVPNVAKDDFAKDDEDSALHEDQRSLELEGIDGKGRDCKNNEDPDVDNDENENDGGDIVERTTKKVITKDDRKAKHYDRIRDGKIFDDEGDEDDEHGEVMEEDTEQFKNRTEPPHLENVFESTTKLSEKKKLTVGNNRVADSTMHDVDKNTPPQRTLRKSSRTSLKDNSDKQLDTKSTRKMDGEVVSVQQSKHTTTKKTNPTVLFPKERMQSSEESGGKKKKKQNKEKESTTKSRKSDVSRDVTKTQIREVEEMLREIYNTKTIVKEKDGVQEMNQLSSKTKSNKKRASSVDDNDESNVRDDQLGLPASRSSGKKVAVSETLNDDGTDELKLSTGKKRKRSLSQEVGNGSSPVKPPNNSRTARTQSYGKKEQTKSKKSLKVSNNQNATRIDEIDPQRDDKMIGTKVDVTVQQSRKKNENLFDDDMTGGETGDSAGRTKVKVGNGNRNAMETSQGKRKSLEPSETDIRRVADMLKEYFSTKQGEVTKSAQHRMNDTTPEKSRPKSKVSQGNVLDEQHSRSTESAAKKKSPAKATPTNASYDEDPDGEVERTLNSSNKKDKTMKKKSSSRSQHTASLSPMKSTLKGGTTKNIEGDVKTQAKSTKKRKQIDTENEISISTGQAKKKPKARKESAGQESDMLIHPSTPNKHGTNTKNDGTDVSASSTGRRELASNEIKIIAKELMKRMMLEEEEGGDSKGMIQFPDRCCFYYPYCLKNASECKGVKFGSCIEVNERRVSIPSDEAVFTAVKVFARNFRKFQKKKQLQNGAAAVIEGSSRSAPKQSPLLSPSQNSTSSKHASSKSDTLRKPKDTTEATDSGRKPSVQVKTIAMGLMIRNMKSGKDLNDGTIEFPDRCCFYYPYCLKNVSECNGFSVRTCTEFNEGRVRIPDDENLFLAVKDFSKQFKKRYKRKQLQNVEGGAGDDTTRNITPLLSPSNNSVSSKRSTAASPSKNNKEKEVSKVSAGRVSAPPGRSPSSLKTKKNKLNRRS